VRKKLEYRSDKMAVANAPYKNKRKSIDYIFFIYFSFKNP